MKHLITIGRMEVDVDSIRSIEHHCLDSQCKHNPSCCACYEVCLSRGELPIIAGCCEDASKFSPRLRSKEGLDNIFDETDGGYYAIDTDENGLCVFAYRGKGGILCSLHTAALRLGIPPHRLKPKACVLWPLSISEGRPARLAVHEDAFSFSCNTKRKSAAHGLCPSIANIIECIFGKKFRKQLDTAIA